jgi:hypothetical protein
LREGERIQACGVSRGEDDDFHVVLVGPGSIDVGLNTTEMTTVQVRELDQRMENCKVTAVILQFRRM